MSEEYQSRFARLQANLKSGNIEAALITSTDSIYYLTGFRYVPFERAFFIIVRPEGELAIITPRIEAENMATISLRHRIVEYTDYPAMPGETYLDALGTEISKSETIAVEPTMPAEWLVALASYAPKIVPLIETLRLVKSQDEIRRVQKAAKYSDKGLRMIMEEAELGRSIMGGYNRIPELRAEISKGEGYFDQYTSSIWLGVWAAPFSAQPHRFPEPTDIFQEGPNVGLSFLRVNGYSAETERTFFVNEPSAEQAEVFATMIEAADIGFSLLKPGVSCHEVDHKVMTFLRQEGFENNLLHRVGHGIGMGGHEGPWVAEGSEDVLEENMIISIEPGIYWRGQGGYRHSDTVLITEDGYSLMTDFPRDITSMTLA